MAELVCAVLQVRFNLAPHGPRRWKAKDFIAYPEEERASAVLLALGHSLTTRQVQGVGNSLKAE